MRHWDEIRAVGSKKEIDGGGKNTYRGVDVSKTGYQDTDIAIVDKSKVGDLAKQSSGLLEEWRLKADPIYLHM